ncbi:MAG: serine/threonine protein kinase [Chroococcidiopsidaceae cyanobacterium CP_BM_RX_35]|nr:serine/threonine protein kinase [Chroococcidiopsidaceae cyanobacterium CP_BM_RX_35]
MLGKLLEGRYQIVQVLSKGGFGQTYLAQDTHRPGRPNCVVKHLMVATSSHTISPQALRWLFIREVEALKKLGAHDQVPQLLDYFEDKQDFYLVQEFIKGHLLSTELPLGHCWTESQVVQLLQEVLGILEFVHSHALIHRDIKPSNIIRRERDSRLVLIDFGSVQQASTQIVRFQGKTRTSIAVSIPGTIGLGTPGYMPIEQEQGRPRLSSDIYALGMIGIRALTGLKPTQFSREPDTGELIWHQAQVSKTLADILSRMVQPDYRYRYESATEVLQALLPLTTSTQLPEAPPLRTLTKLEQPTQKLAPTPPAPPAVTVTGGSQVQKEAHVQQRLASAPTAVAIALEQTSLPKQHNKQVIKDEETQPLLEEQTSDITVSAFPSKSALLIGLAIGIISGLVLMVVSYYSLQLPAAAPKTQSQSYKVK